MITKKATLDSSKKPNKLKELSCFILEDFFKDNVNKFIR